METEAFSSLPVSVPPETPTIVVHSAGKGYKMDRRNRQRVQQSFAEPFVIHISVSVELDFWFPPHGVTQSSCIIVIPQSIFYITFD